MSAAITVPDYPRKDFRGFLFVVHETHGLLLLYCTRKKNKGPHFQLPGGHVDEEEFLEAARETSDPNEQLLLAAKAGAARELYEETGIDLLRQLDRLQPSPLQSTADMPNLYKDRLFYYVLVTDADFPKEGVTPMGTLGKNLRLKLSVEHAGFIFQPEPDEAAEMIQLHSGGKCAEALRMAQRQNGKPPPSRLQSSSSARGGLDVPPPPSREQDCWCFLC